jgi:hypothetical protein
VTYSSCSARPTNELCPGAMMQATTERIEVLRDLLERLGDPGITLGEAKVLRGRLVESMERSDEEPQPPSGHGADGHGPQGNHRLRKA